MDIIFLYLAIIRPESVAFLSCKWGYLLLYVGILQPVNVDLQTRKPLYKNNFAPHKTLKTGKTI